MCPIFCFFTDSSFPRYLQQRVTPHTKTQRDWNHCENWELTYFTLHLHSRPKGCEHLDILLYFCWRGSSYWYIKHFLDSVLKDSDKHTVNRCWPMIHTENHFKKFGLEKPTFWRPFCCTQSLRFFIFRSLDL